MLLSMFSLCTGPGMVLVADCCPSKLLAMVVIYPGIFLTFSTSSSHILLHGCVFFLGFSIGEADMSGNIFDPDFKALFLSSTVWGTKKDPMAVWVILLGVICVPRSVILASCGSVPCCQIKRKTLIMCVCEIRSKEWLKLTCSG